MSYQISAFQVRVSDRVVGHLFQRGDFTWMEWQEGYWDDPNRPVLGLGFELGDRRGVSSALRLPPWFSNLLPEGRLREWVARDIGISADREMMLLRRLGHDLPGAVRIDHTAVVDPLWRPTGGPPPPEPTERGGRGPLRFSLAGVALKFSMLKEGDHLTLPAGSGSGDWIVKLPDATYPAVPENEFSMMRLAQAVGIEVPETRLVPRDELSMLPDDAWPAGETDAYAVRRFDRGPSGRTHMEDLCQVRGFYPEDKYRGSFDTVANLVYRRRDLASYLELVRRIFFSMAIGNGDMHLKNVTLIYPDGRVPRLSPAYDLVSTVPYGLEDNDLGLKLDRSRQADRVTMTSFRRLAQKVGAPEEPTIEAVANVASRLMEGFSTVEDNLTRLPEHRTWLSHRLGAVAKQFS